MSIWIFLHTERAKNIHYMKQFCAFNILSHYTSYNVKNDKDNNTRYITVRILIYERFRFLKFRVPC
jgi:hypothetical protein